MTEERKNEEVIVKKEKKDELSEQELDKASGGGHEGIHHQTPDFHRSKE